MHLKIYVFLHSFKHYSTFSTLSGLLHRVVHTFLFRGGVLFFSACSSFRILKKKRFFRFVEFCSSFNNVELVLHVNKVRICSGFYQTQALNALFEQIMMAVSSVARVMQLLCEQSRYKNWHFHTLEYQC